MPAAHAIPKDVIVVDATAPETLTAYVPMPPLPFVLLVPNGKMVVPGVTPVPERIMPAAIVPVREDTVRIVGAAD